MVPAVRAGRACASSTAVAEPAAPTWAASTPISREGQHGDGLLLRRHDALEVRVARLVGLVGDGEQHRQLGLEAQRGVVGFAHGTHRRGIGGKFDVRHLGQLGQAQAFGQLRGNQRGLGIGGGHAGDDEVEGAQVLHGRGEGQRGGPGVGPGQRVVAQVHALGGAHLQGLLHGVRRGLRAHAQGRDGVARRRPAARFRPAAGPPRSRTRQVRRAPSPCGPGATRAPPRWRSNCTSGTCLTSTRILNGVPVSWLLLPFLGVSTIRVPDVPRAAGNGTPYMLAVRRIRPQRTNNGPEMFRARCSCCDYLLLPRGIMTPWRRPPWRRPMPAARCGCNESSPGRRPGSRGLPRSASCCRRSPGPRRR